MRSRWLVLVLPTLAAFACGDAGSPLPLPSTTQATTSTATSQAPTTTVTTQAPLTTSTVTTQAPTTTAALPQVVFDPDGIGFAMFGEDPDSVLATAQLLWGRPDSDTGLLPSDIVCPGTQYRKVSWAIDEAVVWFLFTDAEYIAPGGVQNFTGYGYQSPMGVTLSAGMPHSIDVRSPLADLITLWPEAMVFTSEFTSEEMFLYTPGFSTGIVLSGRVTGSAPFDSIVDVYGGRTCLGDAPGGD
jgi:hypothetical protein